ncbi:MAG TPA: matrixin family metalloprotease [Vicinamibacterales bacterium]|nr:matrixin family metalloprotease [Vicinamibacterales bacterium]
MKRAFTALLIASLVLGHSAPAHAYLKFGVPIRGQQVTVKWAQTPVRYFVSDTGVPGVSAVDFQNAVGRAFATWQAVPTASITYQLAGVTSALPGSDDGSSVLGFRSRPDLDRVLASTSFLVDSTTGALIESDIFFNSAFQWSTAAAGETGRYDLESIALHEIGHFSGLGHSALGETEMISTGGRRVLSAEAVMFPIAFAPGSIAARTLKADDIAGISDLYPDGDFQTTDGSLSGSVTKDGQPLFGAHVVAFNPATGTMVAGFTLNAQGQFSIGGLSPGPYAVRVEPLDDADIDSFFSSAQTVDIDFRVAFFDRVVAVPKGGDSGQIALKVVHK